HHEHARTVRVAFARRSKRPESGAEETSDDKRMHHELIVEVVQDVWQRRGDEAKGQQPERLSARKLRAGCVLAATGDEHKAEDVLAKEVERVKERRDLSDMKSDDEAGERE